MHRPPRDAADTLERNFHRGLFEAFLLAAIHVERLTG